CLFTDYKGKIWRGDNFHQSWKISYAKVHSLEESIRNEFFPGQSSPLDSAFYSLGLPVYFHPFQRLL
ncbi:MAG: hypothetical protein NXH75_06165, partial [Halobacteriovoraceae bacterium]|nr:hypothetical protein [Halobacteriovoraceae bacterium]